jgi:peptidoglycan/xylan/chitin deacetylase (PgdA/CDA1 family)
MPTPTVVLYHHFTDAPTEFEAGIGVASRPESFARHLEYFRRNYDMIGLNDLIGGSLPARPLLLTFDDAYRSVLEMARAHLAPAGIPAVLFTNPHLLAPAAPGLDNVLSWYSARHGLGSLCARIGGSSATDLGELLQGPVARMGSVKRQTLRLELMREGGMGPDEVARRSPVLTPDDLRELVGLGVEIGNHTASHVHCRALDPAERRAELVEARERLEALCGRPVRAFSVPYGNSADLTPDVLSTLRESGHQAIFLVHARSNRFRPAPDIWYRVSLHDEPISRLHRSLRLMPMLRSLRARIRA